MRTRSWATASRVSIPRRVSSSRLRSCSVPRASPMIVARTARTMVVIICTPAPGSPAARTRSSRRRRRRRCPGEERAAPVGQVRGRGVANTGPRPTGGDRVAEEGRQTMPAAVASRTANGALGAGRSALSRARRSRRRARRARGRCPCPRRAAEDDGEHPEDGHDAREHQVRPRRSRPGHVPSVGAPAARPPPTSGGERILLAVDGARLPPPDARSARSDHPLRHQPAETRHRRVGSSSASVSRRSVGSRPTA